MDIAARGTYRAQLTKIANSAQEYLSSPGSRVTNDNASEFDTIEEECTVFLQRITAVRENLLKANQELHQSVKSEDFQKESDSIAEYEDKAISLITRLKKRLSKLAEIQNHRGEPASAARGNQTNAAKLPQLALRTFSGNFKDWLPFWERFRSAVHERTDLSGADKFNYLQLHLTGKAAESIAGFIPSDENYNAAVSMLQEEYGNKEKLVDYTVQQLMALSVVSSRRDITGLRKLYNDVTTHTRSLTSLGVPSSKYSVMLKSLLLKCMPRDLVTDIFRSYDPNAVDSDCASGNNSENASVVDHDSSISIVCGDQQLRMIMKVLKTEVESLERTILTQTQPQRSSTLSTQKIVKSAAGLLTPDEVLKCVLCKSKSHSSHNCTSSLSIQERKEVLKREGRCYRCTGKGHNSRTCPNRAIKCEKCKGRHSTAMCDPSYRSSSSILSKERQKSEVSTVPTSTANLCSLSCQSSDVFLQTARAFVLPSLSSKHHNNRVLRMILDGGSQRSYIKESVVSRLGLKVFDTIKLRIVPFGCNENSSPKTFKRVQVHLKGIYEGKTISLLVVVVPSICVDVVPVPDGNCNLLNGILLADNNNFCVFEEGISLLIGADHYWNVVLDETKRISEKTVAINTIFGWTVQGPFATADCEGNILNTVTCTALSEVDECDIRKFWDLESIGIAGQQRHEALNDFENSIYKNNGRYEARLLWRDNDSMIDSNRDGAIVRFKKLIHKLASTPGSLEEYDSAMWEMISLGIAEKVTTNKLNDKIFYMPHRPVHRSDKATTKLRIVFDASAHTGNALSLNQHLFQGPNLLPDVLVMLLNFRVGLIGIVADIEKAFLQISLNERDRDVHRYFWFGERISDIGKLPPIAEYRMTRVTFGVACSPYILCATLNKHFNIMSDRFPDTCRLLCRSFYMDDLITSVNDLETASTIYEQSCLILREASMNIRKWNSNDPRLREHFNDVTELTKPQKVLGLVWSCHDDELKVDFARILELLPLPPTKRNNLSLIARIYDPLGVSGPYTIGLKILFQEIWKLHLEWDEPLPHSMQTSWNNALSQIEKLKEFSIPRCLFTSAEVNNTQLHIFADASPKAYGAVAYVRSTNENGSVHVSYLLSKNRVAPLKSKTSEELTLPKLELTAALIASRLNSYIQTHVHLKFDAVFLWSDSRIALSWIMNDNRNYQPYVKNRVHEIRTLTGLNCWYHCPGPFNPADNLTRCIVGKRSTITPAWISGPDWLSLDINSWPGIKFSPNVNNVSLCLQNAASETNKSITALLNIENYSRYRKILRITAYVFRFINRTRRRQQFEKFLVADEILKAEIFWIRYTQQLYFPEEVKCLMMGKPLSNASSILTLRPIMDERSILRAATRL